MLLTYYCMQNELSGRADALALLPPFPGKTIGKIRYIFVHPVLTEVLCIILHFVCRGKALEHRREQLEAYIWALVTNQCFNNSNLVDVLCSFLEV